MPPEKVKVAKAAPDGAVLPLGRGAKAPFVDYGTPHQATPTKVGVRVHAVRKGRIADFEGFSLDRKQRRSTPYYVDASFKNLGDFALSRNLLRASAEDPAAASTGRRRSSWSAARSGSAPNRAARSCAPAAASPRARS